jgi:Nucleotidyltransferase domain
MTSPVVAAPAVAVRAVELARRSFADNLRLAFVGGSYARGTAKPTSDVDAFVLIRRADMGAEREFATALRVLHERAGLSFDHCGEVFDECTLDELLTATDQCVTRLPAIQQMACYQADCLLSIFRKGDVTFKFLADPKIAVTGDLGYLAELERRAEEFFGRFPMRRVQQLKGRLTVPVHSPQAALLGEMTARFAGERWLDTPVGVGLHRWFADLADPPPVRRPGTATSARGISARCPLPDHPAETPAGAVLRHQCLGCRSTAHHVRGEDAP